MNSKRMKNTRFAHSLGAMAGIGLLTVSAMGEDCYHIVDLGALGFTPGAQDIFGINNANQAVFTTEVAGEKHAMLYLPAAAYNLAAGVHDLHALAGADIPGDESAAHDINDAGIVVGWGEIEGEKHAFVWRLDRDPFDFIDLGTFSNGDWSEAWAINDESPFPIIVGDGENKDDCNCDPPTGNLDIVRGFWLPLTDPADDLPTAVQLFQAPEGIVGCDQNTLARDVNTAGLQRTAAGYSFFGTTICHAPFNCGSTENATVWQNPNLMNSTGTALPFLNGDDALTSVASGISDLGATVGSGYTLPAAPCKQHALYWHTDTSPPLDLSLASGMDPSAQMLAVRINNNDSPETLQAVGWKLASPDLAFLWECDSGCDVLANWSAKELDGTILHCSDFWSIRQAHDVNDDGWIIGWGDANSGGPADYRAVILFPEADCAVCCFADLDCDGNVGVSDLLALLGAWGSCIGCAADLDCDGSVGVDDLLLLLAVWGTCPSGAPSEIPKTVQDCYNKFYPQDMEALIACIEAVSG